MSAPLDILIVTPARRGSLLGNRVTAERWGRLLGGLGHRVTLAADYEGQTCDLLIALHARRSAGACARFKADHPGKPLILALTGTDLYRDIRVDPDAQHSLELADRLIVLHPDGADELPAHLRPRVWPIVQSVSLPPSPATPAATDGFQVCVLGHLRQVKDPFRAAQAARLLPDDSRLQIVHLGRALDDDMAHQAEQEQASNPRYRWLGGRPHAEAIDILRQSHLHVLSSHMEGGANALCESIACGVPSLASAIASSSGLLGAAYPGLFPTGDTRALAELMGRAETDAGFYAQLRAHCAGLAELVSPAREIAALDEVVRVEPSSA